MIGDGGVASQLVLPGPLLGSDAHLALLDALPVAVVLIDRDGVVQFVNLQAAEMVARPRRELCGVSLLDFVEIDDATFAAELLLTGAASPPGRVMGPSRLRYVDDSGASHWTQVWAQAASPELGLDGFVLTLTNESVRDVLVSAVRSLAADDELDRTLVAIATSVRARPLQGIGAILRVEPSAWDDMRFRVVGDWPLDSAAVNAYGTPWRRALVERKRVDVEDVATCGLTQGARDGLLSARVRAVFVRPIRDVGGEVVAVFVTFRRETGTPNSNQDEHLDDACGLAGLAIAQVRRRIEIENGPLTDAMTGIANRTSLNERLESDRRGADALFVDLDHFKSINDMFGTQIGDQVLVEAAHRIAASIRRNDTVYRTGVDEFVVVCEPSGDDPAQRIAIAERLISRLMAPFDVGDHRIRIAASVGIAQALDAGLNATVRAANSAMLTAKESGRAGWRHAMPPTPAVVGATA